MPVDPSRTHYYRRARFTTRLPIEYQYAPSHFWLQEYLPGVYRVGLTHFATRMLGDYVESEFPVEKGTSIEWGETLGWIEGFKAIADIYSVVEGEFLEPNTALATQPEWVDKDPYDRGWLYKVRGKPDQRIVDYLGYVQLLDIAIDRILEQEKEQEPGQC